MARIKAILSNIWGFVILIASKLWQGLKIILSFLWNVFKRFWWIALILFILGYLAVNAFNAFAPAEAKDAVVKIAPVLATPVPTNPSAPGSPDGDTNPSGGGVPAVTPVPLECGGYATDYALQGGGEVENNHDDGDAVMGTILYITRDNPSKEPLLFLVMPGYSIDVEYVGKMYFTADRYDGEASTVEAACLAEKLHLGIINKIFVGEGTAPSGWVHLSDAQSWAKLKAWQYTGDEVIKPDLTATEGIFISGEQESRTIETGARVAYGQFWNSVNPGFVIHIQVRQSKKLTIPKGWQGTYWLWSGDFTSENETALQQRIVQASSDEVSPRDDIKGITMLLCGEKPAESPDVLFDFAGSPVNWTNVLDDWTCE